MNEDTGNGCAIGCGLLIGLVAVDYLLIVGGIALICWCFSPLGLVFNIRLVTGCWLILYIIWYLLEKLKKFIKSLRS